MFDLVLLRDTAQRLVNDQFEARPASSRKVGEPKVDAPVQRRSASTRPRRLLASLRAVGDR